MLSNNSGDKIIENIVKGALEFSKDQIISLLKKLKNRKLAFIGEEKTIEIAREQYKSGESKFYHRYIRNKEMLFLIGMGLTLRRIEKDAEKRQNLRNKILRKHGIKGLHIAEFVQNGILNRYIGLLLEVVESIEDLENQIEEVLKDIRKHSIFVQNRDQIGEIIRKALTITDAFSPTIFVISGEGPAAELLKENIKKIDDSLREYSLERIITPKRECLFFKRDIK